MGRPKKYLSNDPKERKRLSDLRYYYSQKGKEAAKRRSKKIRKYDKPGQPKKYKNEAERKEARRLQANRWRLSEEGKKYLKSERWKKIAANFRKTEKFKLAVKKYRESEKGKKATKAYNISEAGKQSQKKWLKTEKGKKYSSWFSLKTRVKIWLISGYKTKSLEEIIGCSRLELRRYLEKKFQDGMNWKNHGKWHIDHIQPLSKFNPNNIADVMKANHYTNLQPLWAKENLAKGNK